jgi:hypothetical protein
MNKEINIRVIPHSDQAYRTVGNYWYDKEGILQIRVSDMKNPKYHMLVILHEIIEQFITENDNPPIEEKTITDFDLFYEKSRDLGLVPELSEPGFSHESPYRKHHTISCGIEMVLAALVGVDWLEYDKAVNEL